MTTGASQVRLEGDDHADGSKPVPADNDRVGVGRYVLGDLLVAAPLPS